MASWRSRDPTVLRSRAMAHVMRPELDLILRREAARSPAVTIVHTLDPHVARTAARMIDASGRTAVSAFHRIRPAEPFVVRTIITRGHAPAQRARFNSRPCRADMCIGWALLPCLHSELLPQKVFLTRLWCPNCANSV